MFLTSREAAPAEAVAVAGLAEALERRGNAVELVLARRDGVWSCPLPWPNGGIEPTDAPPMTLADRLLESAPEVTLTLDSGIHRRAQWLASRLGVPHRVLSGLLDGEGRESLGGVTSYVAAYMGLFTRIVAPSHTVFDLYADHPPAFRRLLRVVPRGYEIDADQRTRKEARRALKLPSSGRLALVTGPLTGQRGIDAIIAALAMTPKLTLIITGDGPERAALETQVRAARLGDRVRMLPPSPPPVLRALMRACDLYLEPGHGGSAAMPALMMALATGLPVLAQDSPLHVEVLTDGFGHHAGLLVPDAAPEDAPSVWSKTILKPLEQIHLRRRLGLAAAQRSKAYTFEAMARHYERLFQDPLPVLVSQPAPLLKAQLAGSATPAPRPKRLTKMNDSAVALASVKISGTRRGAVKPDGASETDGAAPDEAPKKTVRRRGKAKPAEKAEGDAKKAAPLG